MADELQNVFVDLVEGLDECTQALHDAAAAFNGSKGNGISSGRSSGSSRVKSGKGSLDSTLRDAEKMFSRNSKNNKDALTMQQKIGKTFITSLQAIGRVFIKEFSDSINRVSSNYLSNLSSITARMQLSNEQYAGLYNKYASKIYDDFRGAFSVQDFSNSLVSALDQGLRGPQAKEIAYRNMITNKLVPAISTNTQAYRRMSTTLGDSFNKNITAMAKYAESINAATGIEEGKLNANIETFEKEFMYKAAKEGMSEEDASEAFAKFQMALAKTTSVYGEETTQFLIDELKNTMNGKIGSGSLFGAAYGDNFTPKEAFDNMLYNTEEMFGKYIGTLEMQAKTLDEDALSVYGDIGLTNLDAVHQVGAQSIWGKDSKAFSKELSKDLANMNKQTLSQIYNKEVENLEKGYYTSADDYMSNMIDNQTTWFATWKSNIARFDTIIGILTTIASTVAANFFFTKTKSGQQIADGVKGLFNKGIGTGAATGASSGVGTTTGTVTSGGSLLSGTTGGTGFGGASTVGGAAINFAAGPGALIAGGAMAVQDAGANIKRVADDNGGFWTGTGQAARGLITGGDYMSKEERLEASSAALRGERREMDWGKVGQNTAKGALIGTGIGTAAGGWAAGLGTVIGAGVGAIAGAVTSMIDQAIENAEYNELADAVNQYSESLSMAQQSVAEYTNAVNKQQRTEELLDKMQNGRQQEKIQALKELKVQYASTLANVQEIDDWDSQYVDILKSKVEYERELAGDKALTDIGTALDDVNTVMAEADDLNTDDLLNQYVYDFAKMITEYGGEDGSIAGDLENFNTAVKIYAEKAGMTEEEFVKAANRATNGELIGNTKTAYADGTFGGTAEDKDTYKWYARGNDTYDVGFGTSGDNFAEVGESYEKDKYGNVFLKDGGKKALTEVSQNATDMYMKISDAWSTVLGFAANHKIKDENGNFVYDFSNLSDNHKTTLEANLETFENSVKKYNDNMRLRGLVAEVKTKKAFPDYEEINKALGRPLATFKVGTRTLESDGPIYAHAGEMILTSANADKLRAIDSAGGISGIISGLYTLTKTTASPIDTSTASIDATTLAVTQQTEVLSGILSRILEVVTGIGQVKNPTVSNSVSVSDDLTTYKGA